MTYQTTDKTEVSLLKLDYTGSILVNTYYTLVSEFAGITGQSITGTEITLPTGSYVAEVALGWTRTATTDELFYRIEVDGVLGGNIGAADVYSGTYSYLSTDQAGHSFFVRSSSILKIKITSISSTWTAEPDYSYLLIKRVF